MKALYLLCGLSVIPLLAEIVNFKKGLVPTLVVGLVVSLYWASGGWGQDQVYFNGMVALDNFALAFTSLIITLGILWILASGDYLNDASYRTDKSALAMFALVGAVTLVCFNHLALFFVGLEIMSISLYALAGSKKDSLSSTEASLKYFLLGAFATAFLLLGIALVYGATGSFDLREMTLMISNKPDQPVYLTMGIMLMMVGLSFKISAVPFHSWAPDVYGGAPTSVTMFMASMVKVAAVAAFYKIIVVGFSAYHDTWGTMVIGIMVLTLLVSNFSAIFQKDMKRMLAYSGIAHVGYILLAFVSDEGQASQTVFYYLFSYGTASLGAFYIVKEVEIRSGGTSMENFYGLYKKDKALAVSMGIVLMSLAGIPPLSGFFGKYFVFAQAIGEGYLPWVLVGIGASVVGAYYYFRAIGIMYFKEGQGDWKPTGNYEKSMALALAALCILGGLFPQWFLIL